VLIFTVGISCQLLSENPHFTLYYNSIYLFFLHKNIASTFFPTSKTAHAFNGTRYERSTFVYMANIGSMMLEKDWFEGETNLCSVAWWVNKAKNMGRDIEWW